MKYLYLLPLYTIVLNATPLDKQKILQIIKAAKTRTPMHIEKKQTAPLIVYRKKEKKPLLYGNLPNLGLASKEIQNTFIRQSHKKKTLFTSSIKQENSTLKTQATKIKYY